MILSFALLQQRESGQMDYCTYIYILHRSIHNISLKFEMKFSEVPDSNHHLGKQLPALLHMWIKKKCWLGVEVKKNPSSEETGCEKIMQENLAWNDRTKVQQMPHTFYNDCWSAIVQSWCFQDKWDSCTMKQRHVARLWRGTIKHKASETANIFQQRTGPEKEYQKIDLS